MDGVAEKTIKPVSKVEATIALLLTNDFISRVSCPILIDCSSALRESVLSYDSSPGSRSLLTSAEVGGLHP